MSFAGKAPLPCALLLACLLPFTSFAQTTPTNLPASQSGSGQVQGTGTTSMPGSKGAAGKTSNSQGDSKNASGSAAREHASGNTSTVSPLAPAPPPPRIFNRPRIGLALGGGGALALTEVGTLQWFEEHHIPVDVLAGTSMGCMVSALYSTGRSPEELRTVMNDKVFSSVFSISQAYTAKSFRRREDSREIPNGVTIGLRHGISFRNAVLQDQGLNAFLDREFLRYDDQTNFNSLPIPLRCISSDITTAQVATFARGSIPDAVRASVSLPGVFQPYTMNGQTFVDGGVLDNLPTSTVHDMQADVVLAVSLPLLPAQQGSFDSILGVLQRSFSVSIEARERGERKLANVVMLPDIKGFTANDYLKTPALAKRGYAAAEAHKAELLPYALSDSDWAAYLAHRKSLRRPPAGPVLRVRVDAPTAQSTRAVQHLFAPLVNQPVDTARIEALLDQVRSDGRYQADYTIGYESAGQFAAQQAGAAPLPKGTADAPVSTGQPGSIPAEKKPQNPPAGSASPDTRGNAAPGTPGASSSPAAPVPDDTQAVTERSLADIPARPIILVTVANKKTGPPFLLFGVNIQAQTTATTRATVEGIVTDQDLGGYGAELRSHFALGYLTDLGTEYFKPLNNITNPEHVVFVAPRAELLRQPFPIYQGDVRISERQLQNLSVGGDLGLTNQRTSELRAGFDFGHLRWDRQIGTDTLQDLNGQLNRARVRYAFDNQDRALVPQFGVHAVAEFGYLFNSVGSPDSPQLNGSFNYARRFRLFESAETTDPNTGLPTRRKGKQVFIFDSEFGTDFNRDVAQPFRYTLGGVTRLAASALDQYRGTDYFLVAPSILRRLAELPAPLGQSIYVGFAYELGQIRAPDMSTITRQDVVFGLVAETPLGVISAGPAIGDHNERKFVFTLGRFF